MKLCTPEIVWHEKDPIYSVDFHHESGSEWRLASGGTDKLVKIWRLLRQNGKMKLEFMAHLSRHCKPVNVVRFSPDGAMLASGSDDGSVCVWVRSESEGEESTAQPFGEEFIVDNQENWTVRTTLRGHLEDIYDLSWSPDSAHLVTCSFDETVIVWDVAKGNKLHILREAKQPPQGVVWDPLGSYIATLSRDRSLRVYNSRSLKLLSAVNKCALGWGGAGGGASKTRLYHDESMPSFFRRLSYSPDGTLLITPAGYIDTAGEGGKHSNCTFIFARGQHQRPVAVLPGPEKPTVAVRCCPVLFKLRSLPNGQEPLFKLPYRVVFAVASLDSVHLYDTQQATPIALLSNIHYTNITDLAWCKDGTTLVVSSSDGYCSFVMFEAGELGQPHLSVTGSHKEAQVLQSSAPPTVPADGAGLHRPPPTVPADGVGLHTPPSTVPADGAGLHTPPPTVPADGVGLHTPSSVTGGCGTAVCQPQQSVIRKVRRVEFITLSKAKTAHEDSEREAVPESQHCSAAMDHS